MPAEAPEPRDRFLSRSAGELARFAHLVTADSDATVDLVEQGVTRAAADTDDAARWAEAVRVWIVRAALSQGRRLDAGLAADVDVPTSQEHEPGVRSAFAASSPLQRCVTVLHWFEHLDADGVAAVVGSAPEAIATYLGTVRARLGIDAAAEQELRRLLRSLYEDADPEPPGLTDRLRAALDLEPVPSETELAARRLAETEAAEQAHAAREAAERAADEARARQQAAEQAAAEAEGRRAELDAATLAAEERHERAEAAAADAERALAEAEQAAADAESRRAAAEAEIVEAHALRAAAEQALADAEEQLRTAEAERHTAAEAALQAEQSRGEAQRREAEAQEQQATAARLLAETESTRDALQRAADDAEQRRADAAQALDEARTHASAIAQEAEQAAGLAEQRTAASLTELTRTAEQVAAEREALDAARAQAEAVRVAADEAHRRQDEADQQRRHAEQAAAAAVAAAEQAATQAARAAEQAEAQQAAADREICYRVEAERAAAEAEQRREAAEQAVATAETAGAAALSAVERTERTLLELTAAAAQQRRAAEDAVRERDEALAAAAEAVARREEAERAAADAERRRAEAEQATAEVEHGRDDHDDDPGSSAANGRHRGANGRGDTAASTRSAADDGTVHRVEAARPRRRLPRAPRWLFGALAALLGADFLAWECTQRVHRSDWLVAGPVLLLQTCGAAVVVLLALSRARTPGRPERGLDVTTALATAGTVLDAAGHDLVRSEFRPALDAARHAVANARQALESGRPGVAAISDLRRELARLSKAMLRAAEPTYAEIYALGQPSGFLDLDLDDPGVAAELDRLARRARSPLAAVECARDLLAVVAEDEADAPPSGPKTAAARAVAAASVLAYVAVPVAFLVAGTLPWQLPGMPSLVDALRLGPSLVLGAGLALGLTGGAHLLPTGRPVRMGCATVLAAASVAGAVRVASGPDRASTALALVGVVTLLVLVLVRPPKTAAPWPAIAVAPASETEPEVVRNPLAPHGTMDR